VFRSGPGKADTAANSKSYAEPVSLARDGSDRMAMVWVLAVIVSGDPETQREMENQRLRESLRGAVCVYQERVFLHDIARNG